MRKHISLLCLFMGMAIASFGQITKGKISYSMELSSDNPEMAMNLAMLQGSKMDVYFMPGKSRAEVSMGTMGTMVTVVDEESGEIISLTDAMGQKSAVEANIATTPANDTHYEIELIDETQDILGYACKKAIMTDENTGAVITLWYTNEIKAPTKGQSYYNDQMPGFPMTFDVIQSDVKVKMTATGFEKKVDKSKFDMKIPEGYTKQTMEEFQHSVGE